SSARPATIRSRVHAANDGAKRIRSAASGSACADGRASPPHAEERECGHRVGSAGSGRTDRDRWVSVNSDDFAGAHLSRGTMREQTRRSADLESSKGKGQSDFSDWPLLLPATTYSPTHFRVQYNRPCGA